MEPEPVQLEDIQIVDVPREGEDIAKQVFEEVILAAVVQRIEEKLSYEQKRKTWNKQRIVKQFNELKEKRNKWNYQPPAVPIRAKLNSLFNEYDSTNQFKEA